MCSITVYLLYNFIQGTSSSLAHQLRWRCQRHRNFFHAMSNCKVGPNRLCSRLDKDTWILRLHSGPMPGLLMMPPINLLNILRSNVAAVRPSTTSTRRITQVLIAKIAWSTMSAPVYQARHTLQTIWMRVLVTPPFESFVRLGKWWVPKQNTEKTRSWK